MKTLSGCALVAALAVICIAALPVTGSGGFVAPEDRLSISQPGDSGQWKGQDLTVQYKYSKKSDQVALTGNVNFANYLLMGYVMLQDFRLSVIFVDENGQKLQSQGLTTGRGSFDPIPFQASLTVPHGAVAMAFSYQGEAIDSGHDGVGGPTSFWYDPVH